VWPNRVVVDAPDSKHLSDVTQRGEQRLIQKLVAEPAVEALDKGILLRLTGSDLVPFDAALL